MKYVAVIKNEDGILSYIVWNRDLKGIHSCWNTIEEAKQTALDLNNFRKKMQASETNA